ncbi:helix-turn-helix domain-containing protein [Anaerocolumna sp. AGMB13025]|uniref:ArsR/SmtB family transcription factor n=1 Tax=Anaerocolumna sp. AGMB13025 TaxID=3039116 RepID=UPI00241F6984|nr:helix-turn-helix domain-containing protein [Anaerocolumna sp. AGMB13025]WFR56740.1 helix-turn-helix domain-containing protein [Anaerocolumna sp. AGMB13025]
MAKFRNFHIEDTNDLCDLGKALSSPVRIEMLRLLYDKSLIIGEIAKELGLPASSTTFHLKILEQAGLIRMEEQPGTRGSMKLCTRKLDHLSIDLTNCNPNIDQIYSTQMPVGAFSSCVVTPTCGLYGADGFIGNEDQEPCFYLPERVNAGLLWSSSGYVEYKFANGVPKNRSAKQIAISLEICSEAPGYRGDWKSDITMWINGIDCGTFTCPGDFGDRRGRLNQPDWRLGGTQYGMLMTWTVDDTGCYINGEKAINGTIEELKLMDFPYISVKIGNKPDAQYVGGFNIFGRNFGDYDQDIVLTIQH